MKNPNPRMESVQNPVPPPERPHRVCPWWLGYLLASPIRKIFQRPAKVLAGHVGEGMTVLEPGPGMGFFTLELARMVGGSGRVIAVDVQPGMIEGLRRRVPREAGFEAVESPLVRRSRTALLEKVAE